MRCEASILAAGLMVHQFTHRLHKIPVDHATTLNLLNVLNVLNLLAGEWAAA